VRFQPQLYTIEISIPFLMVYSMYHGSDMSQLRFIVELASHLTNL